MAAGDSGNVVSKSLLLAWDVPPDQEEPWRRFLQELSSSRYGVRPIEATAGCHG